MKNWYRNLPKAVKAAIVTAAIILSLVVFVSLACVIPKIMVATFGTLLLVAIIGTIYYAVYDSL